MQKFQKGDLVHIAKNLGSGMSHFKSDIDAIVMYTYSEKYGGEDTRSYCLHLKGHGQVSWYEEHQLSLIEKNRLDILEAWEQEEKSEDVIHCSWTWILDNWPKIRKSGIPSATICKLMAEIGITNPWGNFGEGVDYYFHAKFTINALDEVLLSGDLEKVKLFILGFPKVNGSISNTNFYKD